MNDVLKKVDQEGAHCAAAARPKRWTVLQRLERLETGLRLTRHRRKLLEQLDAAAGREIRRGQAAPRAARETVRTPGRTVRGSGAAEGRRIAPRSEAGAGDARQGEQTAPASAQSVSAGGESGGTARTLARLRAWYDSPDGSLSPVLTFFHAAQDTLRHAGRRLHHIHHEQRAHRFPESDRAAVQLLLFTWGMLPMLAGRLRERTWGRRRQAISRFGRFRAWVERKKGHPGWFLAGAGALAVLALFFSFYTFGATVTYNGSEVAKVTSQIAVREACQDLETATTEALGGSYTIDESLIRYSAGILPRKDVVDGDTFEEELSQDIGLVTYGYALYIDGEMVGATPYEGALEELLQQLQDGVTDENTISCDFQENVEVKAEYVPTDKIMNLGYIAETLYSTKTQEVTYTVQSGDTWSEIAEDHGMTSAQLLEMNPGFDIARLSIGEVLTLSAAVPYLTLTVTEREQYVEDVPYDVDYTDSAYLYKGDYKVLSAGQYGKADVMADVTYVNGEETERTILSYSTLVNPVTEQQARGTKARPTWLPTGSFRWPCSGHVTSRFGYRNLSYSYASHYHEGIDIANRRGTAIYAADGGTVTYSGWMSGYGYLVRINHGNGYETYYGHNSSILVSVGQHVYKGQQVARMGSTGNSTGNHCHFGVYYNGVAKNPLNYLP